MTDKPIAEYAVIGDCHGAALVARDGSIDWACLQRFDADPLFCRLLNGAAGGMLETRPVSDFESTRRYLGESNVLQTTFSTASGRIRLTDFLPVGRRPGSGVHDYTRLTAPGWIVRIVQGIEGEVEVRARYAPTADFGRRACTLTAFDGGIAVDRGGALLSDIEWRIGADGGTAAFAVRAGDVVHIVVTADNRVTAVPSRRDIKRLFNVTGAFWTEWMAYNRYDGPAHTIVRRSALVLKLLTYAPSGAIAAAVTSSLPEVPGGESNFDYRYCWIRDGAFLLYALSVLGYSGEADGFRKFLIRACRASNYDLQIMYGLDAETELEERELDGVRGYLDSRPVRRGNGAYGQHQLDVFGEALEWALQYHILVRPLDAEMRGMVRAVAHHVATVWRQPDHGIWELRGNQRHYTVGRVMAWVALDRAIRILGADEALARERDVIRDTILRESISRDGVLMVAPDEDAVDASLLLVGLFGFPCPDGVFARTVDAIQRELGAGEYIRRFAPAPGEPPQGAFLACSFWMVSALLLVDRHAEAEALFDRLVSRASELGLYAEEIDPASHLFLGNTPQALTHLALIEAAVNLQLYAEGGGACLAGGPADRARRVVGATGGLRALWEAFVRSGHVGRIRSSAASMMPGWCPSMPVDGPA